MVVLLLTAAALYLPQVSAVVGNRPTVRLIHLVAGYALPIPILLALASAAFRADLSRLNRFTPSDWAWLRSRDRRDGHIPVGKFNAGQKLNAAFTLGAIIVMFATGLVLAWSEWFPDDIRTGATFTHDWLTLVIVVVVAGHITMAMRDPMARVGMRTGEVPAEWAEREHGAWLAEVSGSRSPEAT
jgi:formate dehydrogenase subunit gamma